MRKLSLLIFLQFLLIISLVTAAGDWETYSYDFSNSGEADPTLYNEFDVTTMTNSQGAADTQFQILAADMDGDGVKEIITSNGNYLRYYQSISKTLNLKDEVLLGGTQDSIGWIGDVDNDGLNEYVVSFNDVIYTIDWNGTFFNVSQNYTVPTTFNVASGVRCEESLGSYKCVIGLDLGHVLLYDPNNASGIEYNITPEDPDADFDCTMCPYQAPWAEDYDLDGFTEFGFIGSESITLVRRGASGLGLDRHWDPTDAGYTSTSYKMYGMISHNLDGAGDFEYCVTWSDDRSAGNLHSSHLTCFNSDLSLFNDTLVFEDTAGPGINYVGISNPVVANFDNSGNDEICVTHVNQNTASGKSKLMATCYTMGTFLSESYTYTNTTNTPSHFVANAENANTIVEILAAGQIKSSIYTALVYGDSIFYYDTDTNDIEREFTTGKIDNSSKAKSVIDSDNDGFLEIFETDGSFFEAWFTDFENTGPELNNSLNYGGYGANFDFTSPICVGTTITFEAQECGTNPSCNYNNDGATDIETLRSNCGTDNPEDNLVNGTGDLGNPQYSCFYNTTGIYSTVLFIEDNLNKGNLSQYNTETINVNVIDGVAGVTCNFIGPSVGETGADLPAGATADQIDASLSFTLDLLTGTDPTMKLIIGIGMIIGIVVGVAGAVPTMATSGLFMGIIAFLAIGFVSLFGFLSFWVMILLMAGCGLLILFSVMMGRGSQGG